MLGSQRRQNHPSTAAVRVRNLRLRVSCAQVPTSPGLHTTSSKGGPHLRHGGEGSLGAGAAGLGAAEREVWPLVVRGRQRGVAPGQPGQPPVQHHPPRPPLVQHRRLRCRQPINTRYSPVPCGIVFTVYAVLVKPEVPCPLCHLSTETSLHSASSGWQCVQASKREQQSLKVQSPAAECSHIWSIAGSVAPQAMDVPCETVACVGCQVQSTCNAPLARVMKPALWPARKWPACHGIAAQTPVLMLCQAGDASDAARHWRHTHAAAASDSGSSTASTCP